MPAVPLNGQLDNPFSRHLELISDERISQQVIGKGCPLRLRHAAEPNQSWRHYSYSLELGRIVANASILPPATGTVANNRDLLALIGYGGEVHLHGKAHQLLCRPGDCLIAPPHDWHWQSSPSSLVMVLINPEHLLETARCMAGHTLPPPHWPQRLKEAHLWTASDDPDAPSLQTALRQLLDLVEQLLGFGKTILHRLNVEDQIHRLLAMMIFPDLLADSPLERLQRRNEQQRDSFDDLLDFIQQRLHEPINLSLLVEHSHYSRRSLQYAFRERLGCTASQWIRRQRLDLARQRLQNPSDSTTVASVAASCGYRSTSLFTVDFQQRFQVKPSQLLREARLQGRP